MEKLIWKDEYVYYLIEKVHNSPFIWDYSDVAYKNKFKRKQFWLALVDEMNKEFKSNTRFEYGELLKKWNNLKSYFAGENQKVSKAQKSGASAKDVELIQTNWKYKKALDFLLAIPQPTKSVNNFNKRSLHMLKQEDSIVLSDLELDVSASCSKNCLPTQTQSSEATTQNYYSDVEEKLQSVESATRILRKNESLTESSFSETPEPIPHYIRKKRRTAAKDDTDAGSIAKNLVENSKQLMNLISQTTSESKDKGINYSFAMTVLDEINKLDEEFQIKAKSEIFNIIMNMQAQQLRQKKGT